MNTARDWVQFKVLIEQPWQGVIILLGGEKVEEGEKRRLLDDLGGLTPSVVGQGS